MLLFIFACVALGSCLAVAQALKVGTNGIMGSIASIAMIPALAVALYAMSREIGWWTVAAFVAGSLLVGTIHAIAMRHHGRVFLFLMQPTYSAMMIAASTACAVLLFY